MTRLELLVAAVVLVAVCALSCAQSGFPDTAVAEAAVQPSPLSALIPFQTHSFQVAAIAVTLLGLLLEDGRRRALSDRGASSPSTPPHRS